MVVLGHDRTFGFLLTLILPLVCVCCSFAGSFAHSVTDSERDDWYFRESLISIRDWESILDRLDHGASPGIGSPGLPVPLSGDSVDWPNPFPDLLLPVVDRGLRVQFRRVAEALELIRTVGLERDVRMVAVGDIVSVYRHPGGGGEDQWYHSYHRKFDRLTHVRPLLATFGIQLRSPSQLRPLQLGRGDNEIPVTLTSYADEMSVIHVKAELHLPKETQVLGSWALTLDARQSKTIHIDVKLDDPGGGIVIVTCQAQGQVYWTPLFTAVEDVSAVVRGIELILADTPNVVGAEDLRQLKLAVDAWPTISRPQSGASWRLLFERASRLRDRLLRARIHCDAILFVKRQPYFSEQPFMDSHHLFNRPGGGIYRLSPVGPGGSVTPIVDDLGNGVYRDICLKWDATRLLFAFGNGSDKWDGQQSYNLFEVGANGLNVRQITSSDRNDCEPIYLADGRIAFTSDRSGHFVMCGGDRHSPTLFAMEQDGTGIRQLSYNVFNEFNPTQLPDGRILYSRWEYNERSVTSLHNPFTMNPDGTMVAPYYGNATIRPNVVMFPRPVPNSNQVMALFTAHHGQTHGSIGLIDIRRGADRFEPLTVLTPNVPITGEKALDSRYGWYSDPTPLSEMTYLCSFTPTVVPWLESTWGIYVGDRHGNLALIHRDPVISCAEPIPLRSHDRPHVMPTRVMPTSDKGFNETSASAELFLADVYAGLPSVERGQARFLRIVEDVPRKDVDHGGVIVTANTLIFTVKRVLGTVPIEEDGSAHFLVPADRNVYFEVLDSDHREIQRMRSVVCLKPGEQRGCIGCHEPRNLAPPAKRMTAAWREPDRPVPPPWGNRILSYLRDVQPVFNAKCVACHTHDRFTNRVILTGDLTDQFCIAYEELLPYLRTAISDRWDHPNDVYPRSARTYGSKVSPLCEILEGGHHGVELNDEEWQRVINWVDANAVYYDRYEHWYGPKRRIFSDGIKETLDEVYGRRCAECHGQGDGRHDNWWLSLNWRNVESSRALAAPLSRAAGGWGRCEGTVFANTNDVDYCVLRESLAGVVEKLQVTPRADLRSIRGTSAERQAVEIPSPPPPRRPDPPEENSVYLSDMPWTSARTGWTPNDDWLPRRDRDIRGQRLRLGPRLCRKGIGTHAPSEIVVPVTEEYARLVADLYAAEQRGTVIFRVFGDGRLLVETPVMLGGRGSRKIDVSVAGIQELRLVVTDGGDNHNCDMANWCNVRLTK